MGLKLAVVGGGSTYTPELIEGIARRAQRLPVDELVLLDIDPERLEIVGGLAQRMLKRLGWPGRLVLTGDADAAIDGASFVLIQLRVGGQAVDFRGQLEIHTLEELPNGEQRWYSYLLWFKDGRVTDVQRGPPS